MFQQTFAIIRNTFLESIRQPIMLVVLMIATIVIIFANPLSAFTMADDDRMYIDMGLATVFVCGALLAAFIATNVLGREIENRTALTVISKPVSRPLFVLGKYLGVAGALALATLYMGFVFMLVEQHSVLQTVRDPLHTPVILLGMGAGVIGVGTAIWCNYFYNKVFSSTVIGVTTPLAGAAYFFSMMFRPDFSLQPIGGNFKLQMWLALGALLVAILVLSAIAVAASTRLGQMMTLCVTIGVFLLGMLSDWTFGRQLTRLEQTWNTQVAGLNDASIQKLLTDDDLGSLRAWVQQVHTEQAVRQLLSTDCAVLAELQKPALKAALRTMSESDRALQTASVRESVRQEIQARYDEILRRGQAAAESVQWPPQRKDVVHELEWPQSIERVNGECDLVIGKRTFVYPPLKEAVATGGQRLAYAACKLAYSIVPNFQVLLLSDAVTQEHRIPADYLVRTTLYGGLCIVAALGAAVLLFQEREVG
ncbi:MAG: ABC transporter permease [Phycisphaerales bacterium]|nr:ABC transporter permease [Phycisphaerales bacterium]MCI0629923.1 ABC transporter permease [Phycisphaerales bacterium]MCI0674892.1 ABC transporter permease [Phycisphaerales bacterium]